VGDLSFDQETVQYRKRERSGIKLRPLGTKKRKTNTKGAKKNIDRFVLFASLPLRFLCSLSSSSS
jgi:hypothetical protein